MNVSLSVSNAIRLKRAVRQFRPEPLSEEVMRGYPLGSLVIRASV